MPPVGSLLPEGTADINGAFHLDLTVRFDDLGAANWQTVFDFGAPGGQDNISLLQVADSTDLMFVLYQDGASYRLTVPDVLIEGEDQAFSVGIDPSGVMWIAEDGQRLAEKQAALPADTPRSVQLVGETDWAGGGTLAGEVTSLGLTDLSDPDAGNPDGGGSEAADQIDGAFAIDVSVRFDNLASDDWQTVFDFGEEGGQNNISLMQLAGSTDLMFVMYQDGTSYRVTAQDVIDEGQVQEFSVGIDPDGTMWIAEDGQILAERQAEIPQDVLRDSHLIGESDWSGGGALDGEVLGLTVTNTGAPLDPVLATQGDMFIVAHPDDDLLFMNPTIANLIEADDPVTAVFLTAGDAGQPQSYWGARETGTKAAYAEMAGSTMDQWVDETVTIALDGAEFDVASSYLADQPDVRLYFLRTPDGIDGAGTEAGDFGSLEQLWEGDIPSVTTMDGTTQYTLEELTDTLSGLMELHTPDNIHIQDAESEHAGIEHSDHLYGSFIVQNAAADFNANFTVTSYHGYATWGFEENVSGEDLEQTQAAFAAYSHFDPNVFGSDGSLIGSYVEWLSREYISDQKVMGAEPEDGAALMQMLMQPEETLAEAQPEDEPDLEDAEDAFG